MTFNSWTYTLFLSGAVFIYWLLPRRFRIWFLCLASLLFYSLWKWQYTLLIIFSALTTYVIALRIGRSSHAYQKKWWLVVSLIINLGLLSLFKYTPFVYDNAATLARLFGVQLPPFSFNIILPLGISFYTFHLISYIVDVFRGVIPAQSNFTLFLTYVVFWPQLIAGPILRAKEVWGQFLANRQFSASSLTAGAERVIVGLFKKLFLADRLAIASNQLFSLDPSMFSAFDVWVAAFVFGFQIYFDFSAYSDIALGSAKMLGFTFPENFSWPYLATSPREFWKRWHISLSSWIRDYIYLPLTGHRPRPIESESVGGLGEVAARNQQIGSRKNRALLLTWLLMGLWHGAGWNFIIWGLYHAIIILIFRVVPFLKNLEQKLPLLGWFITLMLSMAGWIAFRVSNLHHLGIIALKIVDIRQYNLWAQRIPAIHYYQVILILAGLLISYGIRRWYDRHQEHPHIMLGWRVAKVVAISIIVFLVITYMQTTNQFIYFQF